MALFLAPLLLVAGAVRCGGDKVGDSSGFRLGAYDHCSADTVLKVPGGGGELGVAGSVNLAQSGSVLTVSYGGDGGVFDAALAFNQASATTATLLPGQQVAGIAVPCAPQDFAPSVAKLQSGSLTYNAGTLFLSVEGADEAVDAGPGCSNPGGRASVLITCREGDGAAPAAGAMAAGSSAAGLGSAFVGAYSCVSSVAASTLTDGGGYESVAGDAPYDPHLGTLQITETSGVLTAAVTDSFVNGSLQFVATTHQAAVPAANGETMQVACDNPSSTGSGLPSPNTLPVAASTLTIEGSSVVLSFTGDMPDGTGCAGAETYVSLLCSK